MKPSKPLHDKTLHWIILSATIYTAVFLGLTILRYHSFFSYEWEDLAELNKFYWNVSHGHFLDYIHFYSPGRAHFTPIVFLISAAYIFWPHIYTLFFFTTFALAIAALPVYLIAKNVLKNPSAAILLAFAYLFYAPKNSLNFLDNDPFILVIPLLLFTFYSALQGKKRQLVIWSILVMSCITYTPLFITFLMLYLYWRKKEFNRINPRTYLMLASLSTLVLVFYMTISNTLGREPVLSPTEVYAQMHPRNAAVGYQPFTAYLASIGDRLHGLSQDMRAQALIKLLAPLLFFPVAAPATLIGFPSIFLIAITDDFLFQKAHYISGLVPFLFIGTIYLIRSINIKLQGSRREFGPTKTFTYLKANFVILTSAAVMGGCLLSNFLPNIIGGQRSPSIQPIADHRFTEINNIYNPAFYIADADDVIAWRMIKMVPPDPLVSVAATGDLLPPLSSRKRLIEFLDPARDYYDVDYILIHNKDMYLGAGQYFWDGERVQRELAQLLKDDRWEKIAAEGNFYLFKKKR